MDDRAIRRSLRDFIRAHRTQFQVLPTIQSQLLELGSMVLVAEHYRLAGYDVAPENLVNRRFKVKRTSAGYPWRFSWFRASRGADVFEIHANAKVAGAYGNDDAMYVVDVAVCAPEVIPRSSRRQANWRCVANAEVVTWVEAKKLVVYPMLLAQFIGIVHEISPRFLNDRRRRGFHAASHFPPALVATGHLAYGCSRIRDGFADRGFRVVIVPNLDEVLASMQHGSVFTSPFELR